MLSLKVILKPTVSTIENNNNTKNSKSKSLTITTSTKNTQIPTTTPPSLLPTLLFLQTYSFITINKVYTGQYFVWYLIFLPFLTLKPGEDNKRVGIRCCLLVVGCILLWLINAYYLELVGYNPIPELLGFGGFSAGGNEMLLLFFAGVLLLFSNSYLFYEFCGI